MSSKPTSRPWHWQDRYDFREHSEHRDTILDSDCENNKMGRIQLVNHDGKVVLGDWADYADDSGLEVSDADRRFIVRACNSHLDLIETGQQLLDRLDEHGSIDPIREEGPIEDFRSAIEQAGESGE